MNNDSSTLDLMKSNLINVPLSLSNQACGACFNPYKDFCNLHIYVECSLLTKPI